MKHRNRPGWLKEGDHIVVAYAQHVCGPGWANTPVWVIVRARNGEIREECFQPDEQTEEMRMLFDVSSLVSEQMTSAVRQVLGVRK